jgi:hypothetical protein
LKLAEDESQRASAGITALHEVSACSFIVAGLELEDQQYAIMYAPLITSLMILQATYSTGCISEEDCD